MSLLLFATICILCLLSLIQTELIEGFQLQNGVPRVSSIRGTTIRNKLLLVKQQQQQQRTDGNANNINSSPSSSAAAGAAIRKSARRRNASQSSFDVQSNKQRHKNAKALPPKKANRHQTETIKNAQQHSDDISLPNVVVAANSSIETTTTSDRNRENTGKKANSIRNSRHPSSLGEAVQLATSASELLELCDQLPQWTTIMTPKTTTTTSENPLIAPSDRQRYQRWSAQLIQKLGNLWPSSQQRPQLKVEEQQPLHDNQNNNSKFHGQAVWCDNRLTKAIMMVIGGPISTDDNDANKSQKIAAALLADQARSVQFALQGLSALAGKVAPPSSSSSLDGSLVLLNCIRQLIQQAEYLAAIHEEHNDDAFYFYCPLHQVVEMRWASRGLLMRFGKPLHDKFTNNQFSSSNNKDASTTKQTSRELLASLLPNMDKRVQRLPFDIIPCAVVDWSLLSNNSELRYLQDEDDVINLLLQEIPFAFDQIFTRQGALITERRGTAWITESGIGSMAYSGKVMPPHSPLPPLVRSIMRKVETVVGMEPGFIDCALCNWYPHEEAAMKYHCDPDHGTLWDRRAMVLAIGDARRFAFRPSPNHRNRTAQSPSSWQDWDVVLPPVCATTTRHVDASHPCDPAVIHLYSGDIVQMWGTCNEDFQHAVLEGVGTFSDDGLTKKSRGRISIVMKHALQRDTSGINES